jgi:putative FmdB family regulatory protein
MPVYQYECSNGHVFEKQRRIAERRVGVECPECGVKEVEIVVGAVSVHSFTPHYSNALGTFVNSRREEKMIAKGLGVESVGDMRIDEIETETRRVKRQEDEKEARKGPPKEFYQTYDEVFRPVVENGG